MKKFIIWFFTTLFLVCTASSCGTIRWGASRTETKRIETEQKNDYHIDNNGGKKVNTVYSVSTTQYLRNY